MREILGSYVELPRAVSGCFLFQIIQARWRCEVSRKRHLFNAHPTSFDWRLCITVRFLSAQPAFGVAVLLLAGLLWTHPAAAQTADGPDRNRDPDCPYARISK
jgi:hypothetical protein